jgi:hypothetical protein
MWSARRFLPPEPLYNSRRDPVIGGRPSRGKPDSPARGFRRPWVLFAIIAASDIVGASLFVVSLPPSLGITEGSTLGVVSANFPTTDSKDHLVFGNFTATTYANQTSGPSSHLRMSVHAYGFAVGYNYVLNYVMFFYDVSVRGTFARNIHPWALEFRSNLTGSAITLEFRNGWDQGPNVSSNRQQAIGFWNNGTGTMTATLTNGGGPGSLYQFEYAANGQSDLWNYKARQFIGFRATVTGWMLPPISVGILMKITNAPKIIPLFPKGSPWTVYGYNETRLDVRTTVPFAVTGAFNASSPVTAYILNLSERWAWVNGGYGQPTMFHWRSRVGVLAASIDATLAPGEVWYLAFVATPLPQPGPVNSITVAATQDIVATT